MNKCLMLVLGIPCLLFVPVSMADGNGPPKNSTAKSQAARRRPQNTPAPKPSDVISLFDGKSLKGWKAVNFGGQGEVYLENGCIFLEMGVDLTGITWQKPKLLPKSNYEVTLEAMRVNGTDFFCGLTFPVRDDPCSLIIGGWGGGLCGLSSLDGFDASENETTTYQRFESERWYKIRLRVTDDKIQAWLDDKQIVDVDTTGRKISIRREVDLSRPFGIASWQTTAALRNIKIRKLEPQQKQKTADEASANKKKS